MALPFDKEPNVQGVMISATLMKGVAVNLRTH